MGVRRDIAIGEQAEQRIIKILDAAGFPTEKAAKGKFSDYDLISTHNAKNFTSEVKYDVYAIRSGNIAIEIYNPKSGKFSGINITKANLWVHITDEIHIASVPALKTYTETQTPDRVIASAGDGNATIYLYAADKIFPSVFSRIDNLNDSDVQKVVLDCLKGVL